MLIVIGFVAC